MTEKAKFLDSELEQCVDKATQQLKKANELVQQEPTDMELVGALVLAVALEAKYQILIERLKNRADKMTSREDQSSS